MVAVVLAKRFLPADDLLAHLVFGGSRLCCTAGVRSLIRRRPEPLTVPAE